MRKLFVALGALLVAGGLAASARAQTDTSASVTASDELRGDVSATSASRINLLIGGTVQIKGAVEPQALGQALVDGKQLLTGNEVWLIPSGGVETDDTTVISDNDAGVAAGAFANATGNVGINAAAGDAVAQDNALTIATVQSTKRALKSDLVKLQEAIGNLFNPNKEPLGSNITNDGTIGDGAFNGADGNFGANVAAGANIGQQNAVAVTAGRGAPGDVVLASANIGILQTGQSNESALPNTANAAGVGDVGVGSAGNLGINAAAGTNVLQNNVLGVTAQQP